MAPNMYDKALYKATGVPTPKYAKNSCGDDDKLALKRQIKHSLRLIDEQDFINRYQWSGLPEGMNQQLLERILYYKGQLMLFYVPTLDKFYFLPYTLQTGDELAIDVYGQFTNVKPLPFLGETQIERKKDHWISAFTRKPLYEVTFDVIPDLSKIETYCVLLKDYTPQLNETIIPRRQINDVYLDIMADCYPMARTNLLANSGIKGYLVQSEDEEITVEAANDKIESAALEGRPFIGVRGQINTQELTNNNAMKTEEYLLYMQSVDNMRLSSMGLNSGGIFEKKAHTLQSEQDLNNGSTSGAYNDGLLQRQRFCMIANSLFGLTMWCDMPDNLAMMDRDMDGDLSMTEQGGVQDEQNLQ